jgi:APA family basic amino acid/polyamine antiporter
MNAAYLYAIPATGIAAGEETTARAAAVTLFSPAMGQWISALIAVSCFGALAAAVLSSARVYYAMARDGLFFRRMANVHPRYKTPAFALVSQAIWASVLMLSGRYDQLVTYLIFMGVMGYILTVGAVFVLRRKLPDKPRPYRCTGYPAAPAIYLAIAALWALNTLWQRPRESLAGLGIVLLGVPAYFYWRRKAIRT